MTRKNPSNDPFAQSYIGRREATRSDGRSAHTHGAVSPAERLIRLGNLSRFLVRHGATYEQVAKDLGIGKKLCELAVSFATASDLLKLRALFENWTSLKIRAQLSVLATQGTTP